jgi:hypothetical protein
MFFMGRARRVAGNAHYNHSIAKRGGYQDRTMHQMNSSAENKALVRRSGRR